MTLPPAADANNALEQWIAKQSKDSLRKLVRQSLTDDAGSARAETLARHRDEMGATTWPLAKPTYDNRSPLQHADSIRAPVIFFQGLDDVVVPPEQTERMAAALRANGIAVEVHLFPEEGHGFRNGATQIQVLEATEAFFRRHFQL